MTDQFSLPASLSESRIDVWWVDLNVFAEERLPSGTILSAEECLRANRFRFERDARQFRICRGLLRLGLAWYLGVEPASLILTANAQGKPRLEGYPKVHFNVSHCQGVGLIAFTAAGEVGIDIESVDRLVEAMEIASAYFSPAEIAWIEAGQSEQERVEFFLRLWTRKEAVLKAVGLGLSFGLDRVDVMLSQGNVVEIPAGSRRDGSRWRVQDLALEPGFLAAVAAPPVEWEIRLIPVGHETVLGELQSRFYGVLG